MIILALGATTLALMLGAVTGLVAAYFGGWINEILMRVADVMFAFPALLLALLILSTLESALIYLIICIGIVFCPTIARVVRSRLHLTGGCRSMTGGTFCSRRRGRYCSRRLRSHRW